MRSRSQSAGSSFYGGEQGGGYLADDDGGVVEERPQSPCIRAVQCPQAYDRPCSHSRCRVREQWPQQLGVRAVAAFGRSDDRTGRQFEAGRCRELFPVPGRRISSLLSYDVPGDREIAARQHDHGRLRRLMSTILRCDQSRCMASK
ncbi:hypothetical protein GCM10023100_01050 [Actinocorallia cavernae]|uniref:Uncharacterized protein n=1 Tax=Actinocorallia cavernae TaxID=328075 RepID=A0ABP8S8F9_9ACTN